MRGRVSGSVTVFLSMSLLLITSLFFTMAESIRLQIISVRSQEISDQAVESLYSMYVDKLWEEYRILGMDLTFAGSKVNTTEVEKRLLEWMNQNGNANPTLGMDLVQLGGSSAVIEKYGLLTDDSGKPFIKLAAREEMSLLGYDAVALLLNTDGDTIEALGKKSDLGDKISEGQAALEEAENYEPTDEEIEAWNEGDHPDADWSSTPNPLENADSTAETEGLGIYIPSTVAVSNRSINLSGMAYERTLMRGTESTPEVSAVDIVLYTQYLFSNLDCYTTTESRNHPLHYEIEYIISGKSSDQENLKSVIHRILISREVENMISIMSDPVKVAEAASMATFLVGETMNPLLVEAVKYGLLASWAYGESLLDLRLLLDGGKVPLVKESSEWTATLATVATCFDPNQKARDVGHGLTYQDYLRAMLIIEGQAKIGSRGLSVVELSIRSTDGYQNIQMDHLMYTGRFIFSYKAKPLFLSLVPSVASSDLTYRRNVGREFSYLTGRKNTDGGG